MSREKVFSAIRAALGVKGDAAQRAASARAYIGADAGHALPEIARLAGEPLRRRFKDQLTAKGCDVLEATTATDLPAAVAAYLDSQGLERRLGAGPGALQDVPWSSAGLEIRRGAATPDDAIGMSVAAAGIAETGTLLVASGASNPVTLAFLPDVHLVVVGAIDLVASLEDAMRRVRSAPGGMPRSVNLISGPSRTGDIGGRIVVGAHGPRRLCAVIVG